MPFPAWFIGPVSMEYGAAWELQRRVQAARIEGRIPDVVLLIEHPPVVTLGRGADAANVLAPEAALQAQGIARFEVDRGGDVTYHGPGQITGYPIVSLDDHGRDLHRYLRNLEEVMIRVLAGYGFAGERVEGMTGVWVDGAKVAALGVKVRRWVTMHGFAFNVDPDLDHFRWIIPCGLVDKPVTSLARLMADRGASTTFGGECPPAASRAGGPASLPTTPALAKVAGSLFTELAAIFDLAPTRRSLAALNEALGEVPGE